MPEADADADAEARYRAAVAVFMAPIPPRPRPGGWKHPNHVPRPKKPPPTWQERLTAHLAKEAKTMPKAKSDTEPDTDPAAVPPMPPALTTETVPVLGPDGQPTPEWLAEYRAHAAEGADPIEPLSPEEAAAVPDFEPGTLPVSAVDAQVPPTDEQIRAAAPALVLPDGVKLVVPPASCPVCGLNFAPEHPDEIKGMDCPNCGTKLP